VKLSNKIIDTLSGHGQLARSYHAFLQSVQPAVTWADVGKLSNPIPTKTEYPVDWKLVSRWAASCPSLAGVMDSVEDYDLMAPRLGWNYAWTRFPQHLHLLDSIEQMVILDGFQPTLVLEPGCFTGGLLHFLADHWGDVPCVGFDVSPVSLDVCGHYSDSLEQKNRPVWLEADFSQIQPANLPGNLGDHLDGGLVILSNVIENLGKSFARYPYLDQWTVKSRLISYWVNQGATVLLSERHPDPTTLMTTIVHSAEWLKPNCKASILSQFNVPTTDNMNPDNPLGEWHDAAGCVIRFAPPKENSRKKKRQ
jgi:hypothetical protein